MLQKTLFAAKSQYFIVQNYENLKNSAKKFFESRPWCPTYILFTYCNYAQVHSFSLKH